MILKRKTTTARLFYAGTVTSLLALIALGIAWELFLAPLRPNGSWMVLKVLPLLLALRGVLKQDVYTLQWSSMLILIYFTEGIVRATSDNNPVSIMLGWGEVTLTCVFFFCAILYCRLYKKASKNVGVAAVNGLKKQ